MPSKTPSENQVGENSPPELDPLLSYFSECERAIRERRYANALFILEGGLREIYFSPESINYKSLISHFMDLIGILKLSLEQNLGEQWQDEIRKLMPAAQAQSPEMRCSFCGKSREDVSKIIVGPTEYICNECVAAFKSSIDNMPEQCEQNTRCSFCGKMRYEVTRITGNEGIRICNECLDICVEIIADAESEASKA